MKNVKTKEELKRLDEMITSVRESIREEEDKDARASMRMMLDRMLDDRANSEEAK